MQGGSLNPDSSAAVMSPATEAGGQTASGQTPDVQQLNLGAWARKVYRGMCLSPKSIFDPASALGQRVLIPLFYLCRVVFFTLRDSPSVWRQRRISPFRQIVAQWTLMWRYRTDPSVYYSSQLYDLPRGLAEVEDYIGRDEIKNGLMKRLHGLQPKVFGRRVSLGNKLLFTRHCEAQGIPVAPIISVVDRGNWFFGDAAHANDTGGMEADYRRLDRDIFVKPVIGRGARDAEWFDWLGNDRYRNKKGQEVSRADVLHHITIKSAREPILVLPKLKNSRDIADLARDSLMVFRIFTCLDAGQQVHVTHAMLRILSKLEPSWPENVEYGVAVDVHTGTLDQLCDDFHFAPDAWWDRHPRTNAQIRWRKIEQWPAVVTLAQAAHRAFIDRTVIGWDIALTDDGPIVIEGNAYPDTHFLQRVHRRLIGASPLAPLLAQHLSRLVEL